MERPFLSTARRVGWLASLAVVIAGAGQVALAQSDKYCHTPPDKAAYYSTLLPPANWVRYFNPVDTAMTFSHPQGWKVTQVGAGSQGYHYSLGARVNSPDGKIAMETYFGTSTSAPSAQQVALSIAQRFAGKAKVTRLCALKSMSPAPGWEVGGGAYAFGTSYVGINVTVIPQDAIVASRGVAANVMYNATMGPLKDFDNLMVRYFMPWYNSIPKGGGGCPPDNPDTDGDGICGEDDN